MPVFAERDKIQDQIVSRMLNKTQLSWVDEFRNSMVASELMAIFDQFNSELPRDERWAASTKIETTKRRFRIYGGFNNGACMPDVKKQCLENAWVGPARLVEITQKIRDLCEQNGLRAFIGYMPETEYLHLDVFNPLIPEEVSREIENEFRKSGVEVFFW